VLLQQIVETSAAVAATRSRGEKVELLAACIAGMDRDEVAIGAGFLAGEPRQRRLGAGWAALRELPPAAADATLTLVAVDAALERIAGISGAGSQAERAGATDPVAAATLKTKAKAIAYNAAANSWPGWGDDAPSHIADASDLAQRSLELVEDLKLGHRQVGTSQWLVGALHLAAGRSDDAIVALTRARDAYGAGGERASELLALGYLALACSRQDTPERHRAELEEICLQLQQDGSPQAMAFVKQLRTADRLL